MSEWKKVKLGDIASAIQTGPFGSQLHQSDYSDKGTPVIMPKDIVCGKIDISTIARVESHHVERLSRHKINEGDILYARRGDVGKCAYTDKSQTGWLCGTGCLRVTIDNAKAMPEFVFFQLQKKDTIGWVEKHAIGATMLNLNTSILSDVPIELPTLSTQHRIANILSRYDSLIENYQKQIKLLEEAAQRLYKEWFVDLHFPGHENTKIVDGVPEGWEKKRIGDIVKTTSGGTPSRSNSDYYSGNIMWVKTKELMDGFVFDTEEKITKEAINKSSAKIVPEASILLAMYGATIGKLGIASKELSCNQACCVLLLSKDNPLRWYLFNWLLLNRDYLISQGKGAAQPNLSQDMIKKFELVVPDDNTLLSYHQLVNVLYMRNKSLQSQIRLLTEARNRLLPKLMSGGIAV